MAMTNAERQARYRNRVKARQASLEQHSQSRYGNVPEEIIEALWANFHEFQEGIVEIFEIWSRPPSLATECLFEASQAAVAEWNSLDRLGKIALMREAMRVAGHTVGARMQDERLRQWREAHPEPFPAPVPALASSNPRRRRAGVVT